MENPDDRKNNRTGALAGADFVIMLVAMLSIRDLRAPGVSAASIDLADGECVMVRGPSGAGKTLLLRAIADLDPNHGQVVLDGEARQAMPAPAWRRRVI